MSRGNGRGFCRLQCPSIFESWLCETGESRRLGRRSTPEPTYRVRCPESRRCHGWSAAAVQRPRRRWQWSHPELRGRWLNETRWLRFSIHWEAGGYGPATVSVRRHNRVVVGSRRCGPMADTRHTVECRLRRYGSGFDDVWICPR